MKTVRDGCILQDNALSIKLSDQIEQLDELIKSALYSLREGYLRLMIVVEA